MQNSPPPVNELLGGSVVSTLPQFATSTHPHVYVYIVYCHMYTIYDVYIYIFIDQYRYADICRYIEIQIYRYIDTHVYTYIYIDIKAFLCHVLSAHANSTADPGNCRPWKNFATLPTSSTWEGVDGGYRVPWVYTMYSGVVARYN